MIGRISDNGYIIPLDVYVERHYNKMLKMQTHNYMEAILCERYEEYTDYLTKEFDNIQKAKAEQKYEDTYAKWDIISENRATLLGNLHKLTTDNINLQIECLILQLRIDFCNMQNPFLESMAGGRLGFDYL